MLNSAYNQPLNTKARYYAPAHSYQDFLFESWNSGCHACSLYSPPATLHHWLTSSFLSVTPSVISTTDTSKRSLQPYLFVSDHKGYHNLNSILKLRALTDFGARAADLFYQYGNRIEGALCHNQVSCTTAFVTLGNRKVSVTK